MNKNRTHQRSTLPIALVALAGLLLAACGGAPTDTARESGFVIGTPAENVLQAQPVVEQLRDAIFDTDMSGIVCNNNTYQTGGPPWLIGDDLNNVKCEGFWMWDIRGIPSTATVTSATINLGSCSLAGSPFSYSNLDLQSVQVGSLDAGDYGAGGAGYGAWTDCPPSGLDATGWVQKEVTAGSTMFQARGHMVGGSLDGKDDYVSYAGSIPSLMIRYYGGVVSTPTPAPADTATPGPAFVAEWPVEGQPRAIAVGPSGEVFVTIDNSGRVVKYSAEGELLTEWSVEAGQPGGIAVGPGGEVFVNIDNSGRVVKYEWPF